MTAFSLPCSLRSAYAIISPHTAREKHQVGVSKRGHFSPRLPPLSPRALTKVLLKVGAVKGSGRRAQVLVDPASITALQRHHALDHTGSLRSECPVPDSPSTDFLRSTGEVTDELQARGRISSRSLVERVVAPPKKTHMQSRVTSSSDLAQSASCADLVELGLLCRRVAKLLRKALLEGDREGDDEISRVVLIDPGLDLGEPFHTESKAMGMSASVTFNSTEASTHHLFFLRM